MSANTPDKYEDAGFSSDAPLSPGAAWRIQRWRDAGMPDLDATQVAAHLAFTGDDLVRSLVIKQLLCIPAWARWHAVMCVQWRDVGGGTNGWSHRALPPRALPGDVGHEINLDRGVFGLCGRGMRKLIGHELGHSVNRHIEDRSSDAEALPARSEGEVIRAVCNELRLTREQWVNACVDEELLADRQSLCFGIDQERSSEHVAYLRRHFEDRYDYVHAREGLAKKRALLDKEQWLQEAEAQLERGERPRWRRTIAELGDGVEQLMRQSPGEAVFEFRLEQHHAARSEANWVRAVEARLTERETEFLHRCLAKLDHDAATFVRRLSIDDAVAELRREIPRELLADATESVDRDAVLAAEYTSQLAAGIRGAE